MLRAAIYVWQATYPYAYMYGWALIYTYAYGEMHEAAHTRTGTDTHMGEPRVSRDTRMGSPYAYGLRKIAHTRMGKILVWDGTFS